MTPPGDKRNDAKTRQRAVDILWSVAVVFHHLQGNRGVLVYPTGWWRDYGYEFAFATWLSHGWLGVNLFFYFVRICIVSSIRSSQATVLMPWGRMAILHPTFKTIIATLFHRDARGTFYFGKLLAPIQSNSGVCHDNAHIQFFSGILRASRKCRPVVAWSRSLVQHHLSTRRIRNASIAGLGHRMSLLPW